MSKLNLKGWVDKYEDRWNVPKYCRECNTKMRYVDAIGLIGIFMVWCPNFKCRKCIIFEE